MTNAKTSLSGLSLTARALTLLLFAGYVGVQIFTLDRLMGDRGGAAAALGLLALLSPLLWVKMLGPFFYCLALWSTGTVFARMDKGGTFGDAMTRGLHTVGTFLMLGAVAAIIITPSLVGLVSNRYLGLSGVHFDLSIENLIIGFLGLMLVLLAKRGRALKTELDQFV